MHKFVTTDLLAGRSRQGEGGGDIVVTYSICDEHLTL